MKTVKLVTLGLVGLVSFQQAVQAQAPTVSRIEGLGESQAQVAREELRALKAGLLALDQALAETERQIKDRRSSGTILNGVSIATSGLAAALSFYAGKMLVKSSEGAQIEAALAVRAGFLFSLIATSSGLGSRWLKSSANVEEVAQDLKKAEGLLVQQIVQEKDEEKLKLLHSLQGSLARASENLASYRDTQNQEDQSMFYSHMAQAAGTFISFVTLSTAYGVGLGQLATAGANISRVVVGLSGSNSRVVLQEIANTRTQLQSALIEL